MTKIQEVAAAINAAELKWKAENGGDVASCLDCPDDVKARAALECLARPTEEMIVVGDQEIIVSLNDHRGVWRDPTPAHAAYCAMIDAVLRGDA